MSEISFGKSLKRLWCSQKAFMNIDSSSLIPSVNHGCLLMASATEGFCSQIMLKAVAQLEGQPGLGAGEANGGLVGSAVCDVGVPGNWKVGTGVGAL